MKAELLKSISAIESGIAEMKKLIEALAETEIPEESESEEVEFSFETFLQGRIAVHCDTEEKANLFLAYLHGKGIRWLSNRTAISNNRWGEYKNKTCYTGESSKIEFSDIEYYKKEGYTIILFTLKMLEEN